MVADDEDDGVGDDDDEEDYEEDKDDEEERIEKNSNCFRDVRGGCGSGKKEGRNTFYEN